MYVKTAIKLLLQNNCVKLSNDVTLIRCQYSAVNQNTNDIVTHVRRIHAWSMQGLAFVQGIDPILPKFWGSIGLKSLHDVMQPLINLWI